MRRSARALFVSNGHGEIAIAARIAQDLVPEIEADHLALVGQTHERGRLREVGPRRTLPSGGLIAMANLANIARDLRAGLLAHTLAQLRFLRAAGPSYDAVIAVGDAYALFMALQTRAGKSVFVGTAKSAYVAPYGPFERRLLGAASAVFVRDQATAQALRDRGIAATSANAIVDLYEAPSPAADDARAPFDTTIAIFPGSRETAYAQAVTLCRILWRVARMRGDDTGGILSVAPGLHAPRMASALALDGWTIGPSHCRHVAFSLRRDGREAVRAWTGPLQAAFGPAALVLGQAGTANEAAAAAGKPVVAYEPGLHSSWYRKRQIGLLGAALLVTRGSEERCASEIVRLLDDPARRAAMAAAGRERMGEPGGVRRIAREIERLCV